MNEKDLFQIMDKWFQCELTIEIDDSYFTYILGLIE